MESYASRLGTVVGFDEHRGLGTVVDDQGIERHFHCVEIDGGGRQIAVGTRVRFEVGFRVLRWEAVSVAPIRA